MEKSQLKPIKNKSQDTPIVKELEPVKETKVTVSMPLMVLALAIVVAGGLTGYVLAKGGGGKALMPAVGSQTGGGGEVKKTVGLKCDKKEKEIPEGLLQEGGIDGEGTHHLEREGGAGRNIYLTSSAVPLDEYIGKKIRVCGETVKAEKAGWLIDVLQLETLE